MSDTRLIERVASAITEAGEAWLRAQPYAKSWSSVPRDVLAIAAIEAALTTRMDRVEALEEVVEAARAYLACRHPERALAEQLRLNEALAALKPKGQSS